MQITKFVHSCLLVETAGFTALFDPGVWSVNALQLNNIKKLDDLFITHEHPDHFDVNTVKRIVAKFPDVRITTTAPVVARLGEVGIKAGVTPNDNAQLFDSPHENTEPLLLRPLQIGVNYDNVFSHPGDSHSFRQTLPILALPVTAPWGGMISALKLAISLKPLYIIPIHDWHWSEVARKQTYDLLEQEFAKETINFLKVKTGKPVTIELDNPIQ